MHIRTTSTRKIKKYRPSTCRATRSVRFRSSPVSNIEHFCCFLFWIKTCKVYPGFAELQCLGVFSSSRPVDSILRKCSGIMWWNALFFQCSVWHTNTSHRVTITKSSLFVSEIVVLTSQRSVTALMLSCYGCCVLRKIGKGIIFHLLCLCWIININFDVVKIFINHLCSNLFVMGEASFSFLYPTYVREYY